MAIKIRLHTNPKKVVRAKRKKRIRSRIIGTEEKPRLAIFRSNKHIYVQLVDDAKGHTIASASTCESEKQKDLKPNIDGAKAVGQLIAKRAQAKNISKIVFDRGGYLYHGRIRALADSAREAGLKF